ncbi:MAG TPA: hypothetical protein VFT43_03240, partial [Candidatus Polarisedimenticolia bacterium]|nr:hypothetical protein [Candidatus Polarisedimenticolia bacterium]
LARVPALATRLTRARRLSTFVARRFGSIAGGMLAEIEGGSGAVSQARVFARQRSYLAAVAPAVLAVRALIHGRIAERGLVPHDRHVDSAELLAYLARLGVECTFSSPRIPGASGPTRDAGRS